MCVVSSHGCGGLGGGRDGGGGCWHVGQSQDRLVACREMLENFHSAR